MTTTTSIKRRTRTARPAAVTDEVFADMIHAGYSVTQVRRRTGMSDLAVMARADALGLEDALFENSDHNAISQAAAMCRSYCRAELAALRAAHPGESYRDLGQYRPRPSLNPPLIKYAA